MAKISSRLRLNGVSVVAPAPEGIQVTAADLDAESGTGRSEGTGDAFRDWIAEKTQVQLTWNALKQEEIAPIWNAVKGGKFFFVFYPDPGEGWTEKEFYVSDRTAACYSQDPNTGEAVWTGLSFTLIER